MVTIEFLFSSPLISKHLNLSPKSTNVYPYNPSVSATMNPMDYERQYSLISVNWLLS